MNSSYPTGIHRQVAEAAAGRHARVITRLASGWVVAAAKQVTPGYCLLLSDPVVPSLNSLDDAGRAQYALDMVRVGDALLAVMGAARINYETWCNLDPALHTHIVPRYAHEPEAERVLPIMKAYDAEAARAFDPEADRAFVEKLRAWLEPYVRR